MVLLLTTLACSPGGNYLNPDQACEFQVLDWWDMDLAYAADRGQGADGSPNNLEFRFEPELEYEQLISGAYNQANGNYSWRVNYGQGYFLKNLQTDQDFENYGTIFRNGNIDVRAKYIRTDGLDRETSFIRRDTRAGCAGVTKYRMQQDNGEIPRDPQLIISYSIDSETLITWEGTRQLQGGGVEYGVGAFHKSGKSEELWEFGSGEHRYTRILTRKVGGGVEIETTGDVSGDENFAYTYTMSRAFGGGTVEDMRYYAPGTSDQISSWHAERKLDGSGGGSASLEDGTQCTGSFSGYEACAWDCDELSECPAEPEL